MNHAVRYVVPINAAAFWLCPVFGIEFDLRTTLGLLAGSVHQTVKHQPPLKIEMSFEDALKHVLSVGPIPKDDKPARKPRQRKTTRKKR